MSLYPSDTDFRLIQISHKTRIPKCVPLSLSLLEEENQRPLCLHTLPAPGASQADIENTISSSKRNPDKNGVGRLISIVEIVKREFAGESMPGDTLRKLHGPEPNRQARGQLHQYNEYGSLESLLSDRLANPEGMDPIERQAQVMAHQDKILKEFLNEERKRPRQTHTPYMKIYLSRAPIPSLENLPHVSYQAPSKLENCREEAVTTAEDRSVIEKASKATLPEDDMTVAPI